MRQLSVSRRAALAGLFAVAGLGLQGCGSGPEYTPLSGKVTHKGKPVTAGSVYFQLESDPNISGGAMLDGDGNYKSPAIPVGKCKVSVNTTAYKPAGTPLAPAGPGTSSRPPGSSSSRPPGSGGPPSGGDQTGPTAKGPPDALTKTGGPNAGPPPKYVAIPAKYETVEQSGLSFDIKKNAGELVIDLP